MQDCSHALAALPRADGYYSWYFEQQLETAPPESDWRGWTDNRPIAFRRKVVQVPKFWNHGSCNLALLSHVDGNSKTALSLSRWADVYLAGYTLVQACLNLHSQGGAATVIDAFGRPALTMFLWQNGAVFDNVINMYTSAPFPAGIDPRVPAILKAFGSSNSSVDTFNGTTPEEVDFNHPTSVAHPNLLNNLIFGDAARTKIVSDQWTSSLRASTGRIKERRTSISLEAIPVGLLIVNQYSAARHVALD
ncbi:MAG: hypothetical protein Q9161_002305 [Pseudevernia consocians]